MIKLENVTFQYANMDVPAVEKISLHIRKGECIVLTGHSGCGKTTLTRLINGLVPEYYTGDLYGDIYIDGKNTDDLYISDLSKIVGSVFQDSRSQFFTLDTTAEMAFSCENTGMEQEEIVSRVVNTAENMGIEYLLERSIFELSSGEKQMIAVGSVCAYSPQILVFDEPSANLDLEAVERLKKIMKGLKEKGYTIVISEHRLHYLVDICDKAIFMKDGKIERIFRKEELKNLTFYYDKNRKIFENLNAEAREGQIIGIIGHNGVGKSTFLELLCGLKKPCRGEIRLDNQITNAKKRQKRTYYVMQDSDCQLFTESVEKELFLGKVQEEALHRKGQAVLKQLGLSEYGKRHPASLSGGQKQRLCIAVSCMKESNVLCFDEPTSGLDYESMVKISSIFEGMAAEGKILMVVTHDYEFMMQCCTHVLYMENAAKNEFFAINEKSPAELLEMMTNMKKVRANKC